MAHVNDFVRPVAPASFDPIGYVKRAFIRARAYRKTYNELSALDDHALADIGLRRDDIESIAHRYASSI